MLLKRAMFLKRPIVVTALLTIACALLIPTLSAAQTLSPTSSLLVKLGEFPDSGSAAAERRSQ